MAMLGQYAKQNTRTARGWGEYTYRNSQKATDMLAAYEHLLKITLALSGERDIARLYEQIIEAAQELTHSDGGTLYIVDERDGHAVLRFEVLRNDTFSIRLGGTSGTPVPFAPIGLFLPDGTPNLSNICAYVY